MAANGRLSERDTIIKIIMSNAIWLGMSIQEFIQDTYVVILNSRYIYGAGIRLIGNATRLLSFSENFSQKEYAIFKLNSFLWCPGWELWPAFDHKFDIPELRTSPTLYWLVSWCSVFIRNQLNMFSRDEKFLRWMCETDRSWMGWVFVFMCVCLNVTNIIWLMEFQNFTGSWFSIQN